MNRARNSGGPAREARPEAVGLADGAAVPRSDWSVMGETDHFVQFYEEEDFLIDSLSGFIAAGLGEGDGCVVVATGPHRERLEERLRACGVDLDAALAAGHYVAFDAAATLSKLMFEGTPEPTLFRELIGGLLARAAEGRRRVRVFGEMVALLWAEGRQSAALQLEELWNALRETHSFALFCAYPMHGFGGESNAAPLRHVCEAHARVIPTESYTALGGAEDRLRAVIRLQQKARSLEALKGELELQVEDLRRLHEMSAGLSSTLDIDSGLRDVLRAAMSVHETDMGLLSLWDAESGALSAKAVGGFDADFLKAVGRVAPGLGACGTCYERGLRVVVADVEVDPAFAPHREAARRAGFRACHSTPLTTRGGQIIGVLSVHFRRPRRPSERETRLMDLYARMACDFIENARLHQQLRRELDRREQLLVREQLARAEAERANRLKDEFLATVSHELRTPLTAILGWSNMIQEGRLDEETSARAVEIIERNARVQAQLVEDILDVSRMIAGKLRLSKEPVDLASVINAAIDSVQLAADSKGIGLGVTLDPSARRVSGDAGRLQQVVWNLVSNAIKFTPPGGRVEVRLGRAGPNVLIKVTDTGEGVPREFIPFIFDRFRQADGTSTRRHGGLGLGLAIVRHLVELHGGTVGAESRGDGRGSTFTVSLPLTPAERHAD